MKNRIFSDLQSVKIQNRRIELKLAGYATLTVTSTKRTTKGFRDELWKIGFFLTSNRSNSKIAVLSTNLQLRLFSAKVTQNAQFKVSGTSCEKSDLWRPQIGQNLKSNYWSQISRLGCSQRNWHKTHHLRSPVRVVKNWIFADLKSVKIQNRRIELKFAGQATLTVTNTKRTIRGFRDDLWNIGFLLTSNRPT